jgi:hypothetical protein
MRQLSLLNSRWLTSFTLLVCTLLIAVSSTTSAQEKDSSETPKIGSQKEQTGKSESPPDNDTTAKNSEQGVTSQGDNLTDATEPTESRAWPKKSALEQKVARVFGAPPGMTRLAKDARVWIDPKNKRIVVDGYVALRIGQLEMFACPAGTKEHESLIGLLTKAYYVHAGLLAVGAKPGSPVRFEPRYTPASGSKIKIEILYLDDKGQKQRIPAQNWVRQAGTQKALEMDWVFAGSGMWKDPDSGTEQYLAESGDLICVSNFTTATLDLPIRSSQANSSLLFTAFTDRIPPEQTPVRLVLTVQPDDATPQAPDATADGESKTRQNEIETTTPKSSKPDSGN